MTRFKWRTGFAERIFRARYANGPNDSWPALARRLVEDVCGSRWGKERIQLLSRSEQEELIRIFTRMEAVAGGRYNYYAGRPAHFYNNCYCLRAEDTREGWGDVIQKATLCLMCGGGVGVDYSQIRPSGRILRRTGGVASGPIPLMRGVNEMGRNVMQGGTRRSALWAGLNWQHEDIPQLLTIKDWDDITKQLKAMDFNHPAVLDMTNISILWDDEFLQGIQAGYVPDLWYESVLKMCQTGEPGHCYNFGPHGRETLRNACTEVTSEDDSEVCNLASVNLSRIESIDRLREVTALVAKFLVCGTIRADLPYQKVYEVREKNRLIGVGLMGVHEWLLQRGYPYEVVPELHEWLAAWREASEKGANEHCDRFYLNRPKKYRAIAPAGTISLIAATTSGIEPLLAVAIKRRYLTDGTRWKSEYVIDTTAEYLMVELGKKAEDFETAYTLASDPERRIKFQAEIQQYVDMGISSTINLPQWGSDENNPGTARGLADLLLRYCRSLRGITVYPDNARSGQVITAVPYEEAVKHKGVVYDELAEESCKGSVCGL